MERYGIRYVSEIFNGVILKDPGGIIPEKIPELKKVPGEVPDKNTGILLLEYLKIPLFFIQSEDCNNGSTLLTIQSVHNSQQNGYNLKLWV